MPPPRTASRDDYYNAKTGFPLWGFFFIIFLFYSREMELQTRITSVAASFIRHSYRKAKPEGKRTKHGKGIILSLFFVIFIAPPDTSPHYFKPETWDTWWDTKLNQKIIRCWQTRFPMCVRCVWGLHQTVHRCSHVSWENLSWVVRIKDVFSIALAVISWAADPLYVWLLPWR